MNSDDGKVWYGVGIDIADLKSDVAKIKQQFSQIGNTAEAEGSRIDNSMKKVGLAMAGYFSFQAAFQFAKQVATVRGEFQQLEVSFTTMLGSKEKANALMAQMVQTAAVTPFSLQDVANGAKSLLAYGFAAEDINGTLIRLGNVASGLSIPLNDLTMIYGKMKTQGRLFADDFNQLQGRGIPMTRELSKLMGVQENQVRALVEAGKVGFPQVQAVIESLTNKGGMFFNLMEEQSKTITGQISNLGDTITRTFNEIGQNSEGMISGAIGGASYLIENYKTVGEILAGLVATYGAYKAAVMVVAAAQTMQVAANELVLASGGLLNIKEATSVLIKEKFTLATLKQTAAQLGLNVAMITNPYVMAAVGVTALVAGLLIWSSHTEKITSQQKMLAEVNGDVSKSLAQETINLNAYGNRLTETEPKSNERIRLVKELNKIYPDLLAGIDAESASISALKTRLQEYIGTMTENIKLKVLYSKITEKISQIGDEKDYTKRTVLNDELDALKKQYEYQMLVVRYGEENAKIVSKKAEIQKNIKNSEILSETQSFEAFSANWKLRNERNKILYSNSTAEQNALNQAYNNYKANQESIKSDAEKSKSDLKEITDIENGTAGTNNIAPTQNKSFWEDQKKKAQAALDAMSSSEKGTSEWLKQKKLINQAEVELKNWDFSDKNSGKTVSDFKKEQLQSEKDADKADLDRLRALITDKKDLIDLDYEQTIEAINADEKLFREKAKAAKVTLTDADLQPFAERRATAGEVRVNSKAAIDKEELDAQLKAYQTFAAKRLDIDKKYEQDAKDIQKSKLPNEKSLLDQLNIQRSEEIQKNIDEEARFLTTHSELFVRLFGDMSDKSVSDIRKIADEAQALFDYLSNTPKESITDKMFGISPDKLVALKESKTEMSDIKNQIKQINDQADSLETGFAKVKTAFKNIFSGSSQISAGKQKVKDGEYLKKSDDPELKKEGEEKVKVGNKDQVEGAANMKKGLQGVVEAYQQVQMSAGMAIGLLDAMSTGAGDAADQASKSIGAVMKIADATMGPLIKGDYVGAAVAFVTSTLTQIFESEKAHQQALKKLQDEKLAQQKAYNDLLMKQNDLLKTAETIYGTDAFGQSIGYAQVADKTRNASKNAVANLSGAKVQTGSHKGGLFGWGGEVADYSSLTKTYPDLIDKNGKLNQGLAETILANKNLDETSKKALESALQYAKDYDEALKSMGDYLKSVFGSLGSDMMTAITDNLNSSQDAMDAFGKSAGKTIEKLMSDIAYSMFFADKFKKMQEQALAIQSDTNKTPEEKAAEQTKLLGDFYSGVGTDVKNAQDWLKQNKDMAAKSGFDLYNDATTRTATSKGISSMSQDSADELNGRFTAIQGHTFSISENVKTLTLNSGRVLETLMGIKGDTARLEAIENGMNSVKQGISDINTKGIFIKV